VLVATQLRDGLFRDARHGRNLRCEHVHSFLPGVGDIHRPLSGTAALDRDSDRFREWSTRRGSRDLRDRCARRAELVEGFRAEIDDKDVACGGVYSDRGRFTERHSGSRPFDRRFKGARCAETVDDMVFRIDDVNVAGFRAARFVNRESVGATGGSTGRVKTESAGRFELADVFAFFFVFALGLQNIDCARGRCAQNVDVTLGGTRRVIDRDIHIARACAKGRRRRIRALPTGQFFTGRAQHEHFAAV
jgi:hypothetical protein